MAHGEYKKAGDPQDHVFTQDRDQRDPACGDYDAPVELVGIGVFVCPAASEDVSESHGDHNGSDYYGPYDLG